jgi:hypothetical protein
MPTGQAHTTWFPELKEILRSKWRKGFSIQDQFELNQELNSRLNQIRNNGNMQPPIIWCPSCEKRHRGGFTGVSFTATYFALEKEGIIDHSEFLSLKKEWNKYSKMEGIDVYGEKITQTETRKHNKL